MKLLVNIARIYLQIISILYGLCGVCLIAWMWIGPSLNRVWLLYLWPLLFASYLLVVPAHILDDGQPFASMSAGFAAMILGFICFWSLRRLKEFPQLIYIWYVVSAVAFLIWKYKFSLLDSDLAEINTLFYLTATIFVHMGIRPIKPHDEGALH